MNDIVTLCLIAGIILFAAMLLPRLMGGFGRPDYTRRGDHEPRYNDPNIRSRGSFGRGLSGFIGRRDHTPPSGTRIDSSRIRSRGSFGRSKD